MITADLDHELLIALRNVAALPDDEARITATGTWRPAPDGDPAGYATSLLLALARRDVRGRGAADLAAGVAECLRALPWITAAAAAGGYLTVRVTPQALAASAARMAAAGSDCASSAILRGSTVTVCPWPDLAAAASWQQAWQAQADAMTGQFGGAAGAAVTLSSCRERRTAVAGAARSTRPSLPEAVAYFGIDSVRYRLARTLPGRPAEPQLADSLARLADPLHQLQQAHADAASTLRWAADLQLERREPGDDLGALLGTPAERALLGLLSFLPVRVAAAGRRHRAAEVPRYLEEVCVSWLACRQQAPALPFGGLASARDPATASARLVLADAVRAVLAAGLALTGITPRDRL